MRHDNAWCNDIARCRNAMRCHATPVPGNRFPAVESSVVDSPRARVDCCPSPIPLRHPDPRMLEAPDRLIAALADRYRIERELGAGGMATVYPRPRPEARPQRRAQGAASRARGGHRRRAIPRRDQDHRRAAASAHPAAVRLGAGRRIPLLRDAAHRGREPARPARARAAAAGGRRGAPREGDRLRARLRAPPRRDPPRHQAREHPAARRSGARRRLRHRARREPRRRQPHDGDRPLARHAGLHEPRAGDGRAHARRARAMSTASAACSTRCSPASRRTPAPRCRR